MGNMGSAAVRDAGRPRLIVVVAAIAGFGLGFVVDLVWPNTVYGYQLVAAGIAGVVVLVAAAMWRALPSLLPAAIGAAAGIVAGMMVGLAVLASPPSLVRGMVEIRIIGPEGVASGMADCAAAPGVSLPLLLTDEFGREMALRDGRGLSVKVTIPGYGSLASDVRPDGLGIELVIHGKLPDGSPTSTTMVADPSSTLALTGDARAGTLAFDGLVLGTASEQQEAIDLVGSVAWTCPAEA